MITRAGCPCNDCHHERHEAAQRRLTLVLAIVLIAGLLTLWRVWP